MPCGNRLRSIVADLGNSGLRGSVRRQARTTMRSAVASANGRIATGPAIPSCPDVLSARKTRYSFPAVIMVHSVSRLTTKRPYHAKTDAASTDGAATRPGQNPPHPHSMTFAASCSSSLPQIPSVCGMLQSTMGRGSVFLPVEQIYAVMLDA